MIQQVQNIISRCLTTHDNLVASLRDLSRTGNIQACKAVRKAADGLLKELSKELKSLLTFLQSSPSAAQVLPKVHLSFTVWCCCLTFLDQLDMDLLPFMFVNCSFVATSCFGKI